MGPSKGAVYGLFAGQDLYHPDGKSGIVYNQNDLVAVATTDKSGDASFLAFTEKPGTRLDDDGNIKPLEGVTGPENFVRWFLHHILRGGIWHHYVSGLCSG